MSDPSEEQRFDVLEGQAATDSATMTRVWDDAVVEKVAEAIRLSYLGLPNVVAHHKAARAALTAAADAVEGAVWPCDNYLKPTTCIVALASVYDHVGWCDWCRTQVDAVEGAIRAEVLAPVAALAAEAARWKPYQSYDTGSVYDMTTVDEFLDALRAVLGDLDAIAKHNAAIWDEGFVCADNGGSETANPYHTTEGTGRCPRCTNPLEPDGTCRHTLAHNDEGTADHE